MMGARSLSEFSIGTIWREALVALANYSRSRS